MAASVVCLILSTCAETASVPTSESDHNAQPRRMQSVQVAPEAPEVLRVKCDGRRIAIDGRRVSATAEGIHVRIMNASRQTIFFQYTPGLNGPWGGTEVHKGTSDLGLALPPGMATVRCSDGAIAVTEEMPVEVIDPRGVFLPYWLVCSLEPEPQGASVMAWSSRDPALPDPLAAVRAAAKGLRPSDVLDLGGYPAAAQPIVRLIRGQEVIANFDLVPEGTNWAVYYSACAGSGISVRD